MRATFLSSVLGASWLFGLAVAAVGQVSGPIIVPDTSLERPQDVGFRAHTNHLIFDHVRFGAPLGGLGPGGGMTPAQIRSFYNLPSTGGSGAVIAIVDAYHYPTAVNDFNVFSTQFGLPTENGSGSVFQVIYAGGKQPRTDAGWALEEALDVEWAHAMAPSAKIVLVEAASNSFTNLLAAVDTANKITGVVAVSMSWGGSEFSGESSYDSHFKKSGVVYFAASGDSGGRTIWPGTSPAVVCAGGTSVATTKAGAFSGETGWSGSGGGSSAYYARPSYQDGVAAIVGTKRGVPDVSFDADPNSGGSVYDTTRYQGRAGWWIVGGTSWSSPALAGIVTLAGGATSSAAELSTIYGNLGSSAFRDITAGSAGSFSCNAGWDFVTGVGSCLGLTGK